jgi:hypothetical protein
MGHVLIDSTLKEALPIPRPQLPACLIQYLILKQNLLKRLILFLQYCSKKYFHYGCSRNALLDYLSMALQPFVGPLPLFSFLMLYTVGRTPLTGDQPVARPLPIHRSVQTQNKRAHTSMPGVGFEPTTTEFELAKTVHALDRAATLIGAFLNYAQNNSRHRLNENVRMSLSFKRLHI